MAAKIALKSLTSFAGTGEARPLTMRYAHLAPDHLQDAIRFGPLLAPKQCGVDSNWAVGI